MWMATVTLIWSPSPMTMRLSSGSTTAVASSGSEVPIATIILVATGMVSIDQLKKARAYVLVGAFALGMLLTPPDVISQTLLALPMWVLFEIGLLMSRILLPHRQKANGGDGDRPVDQATS